MADEPDRVFDGMCWPGDGENEAWFQVQGQSQLHSFLQSEASRPGKRRSENNTADASGNSDNPNQLTVRPLEIHSPGP